WIKNGEEFVELKSIRVFDTQSANHYVAKEGVIEYKPIGVYLLGELIKACSYVKEQAESVERKFQQAVITLPQLSPQTKIGKFVVDINKDTPIDSIEKWQITDKQKESIPNKQQN